MKRHHHLPVIGLLLAVALTGVATSAPADGGEAAVVVIRYGGAAEAPGPASRGFEITFGVDSDRLAWLGVVAWSDGRRSADLLGGVRAPDPLGDLHRGIVVTRVAVRFARRWLEQLLEHRE